MNALESMIGMYSICWSKASMVEPMGYHVVTVFIFITTNLLRAHYSHN